MKTRPQVLLIISALLIPHVLSDNTVEPRRRLNRFLSSDLVLNSIYPPLFERGRSAERDSSQESLDEKIKKSLYRLNRPITSRQTRLASFGTMLVPKHQSSNSRPTMRYG